jgi:ribosome-associated protein|tara:strand:+ start:1001 stop:1384 length:384 start_codon:yes stop_codon:yes gene_type:complete
MQKGLPPTKKKVTKKVAVQMTSTELSALAVEALDGLKAQSVKCMDVRHLTSVTDLMILATGRSDRHVRALADSVIESCKRAGKRPLGLEGKDSGEWVLVDLSDVVVHVMLPKVREFYDLEKLWDISP